jgi:hypothetical protein
MPNPFVIPGRDLGDRRPLSPQEHEEHKDLYVPVDHTEQAYSELQKLLAAVLRGAAQTRFVLICGSEGTGKSSLINRIVYWLSAQVEAAKTRCIVVDLTEETASGLASEARVAHFVSRLIDKVGLLGVLNEPEMTKLEQRRAEAPSAVPFLAELLAVKKARMVVVLPRIEVQKELTTIAELSRSPLLFLSETAEEGLAKVAKSAYGTNPSSIVRTVTLGSLTVDDGWLYVKERLKLEPHAPRSDETVLSQFMKARIKGRGMTTILELYVTCQQVWDTVEQSGGGAVSYADFQEFYLVKGSLT